MRDTSADASPGLRFAVAAAAALSCAVLCLVRAVRRPHRGHSGVMAMAAYGGTADPPSGWPRPGGTARLSSPPLRRARGPRASVRGPPPGSGGGRARALGSAAAEEGGVGAGVSRVLIIGGTGRIGTAAAIHLLSADLPPGLRLEVVLCGRGEARGAAAEEEVLAEVGGGQGLAERGHRLAWARVDLTDQAALEGAALCPCAPVQGPHGDPVQRCRRERGRSRTIPTTRPGQAIAEHDTPTRVVLGVWPALWGGGRYEGKQSWCAGQGDDFAGENFGRGKLRPLANPKACTASRRHCTAKAPGFRRLP